MASRIALIALFICCNLAHADEEEVRPVFGAHPGYLFNVVDEKNKRDVEMVMLDKPKDDKKPLSKVIFDEKLTKEFQTQYQYKFGQTGAEQVINNPGRDDQYLYYNSQNVTAQEYAKYQRQFGEYMARRLTEYHFDNWFKNDPTLKPVYEMKDKISNLDVQVKKGYKIKWKYNFAGPSMEAKVENPYDVETKVQVMMTDIISKPADVIYTFGYQLNPRVHLEALYKQYEQLVQMIANRKMSKHIGMSLTASTGQLPGNPAIYQNLFLVGLSYHDL